MRICGLLVIVLTPVVSASAPGPSWFSLGAGPSLSSPRGLEMINAGVRLIVPLGVGSGIADIGGTMVTEPVSLSPFSGQSESTFIVHLAGGLVRRNGTLVTALSAGPAFVQVSTFESVSGRRQLVSRAYPGVYAGAQAITVLSRTVGVGAEAFGVLNRGQTTGGLRLFVAIGSLRQRGP